jgi:hypothetical protein
MADDQGQGPAAEPGRLSAAARHRLQQLHELAPDLPARGLLVAHTFLFAASNPAELETAAAAHDEQARQLRGPIPPAGARTYRALERLWIGGGFRAFGPAATVRELLTLADPKLATQVREDLTAAGVDPEATGWPPNQRRKP